MRVQTITSQSMLDALSALFDQTCTIQQDEGTTTDAVGQPVADWQDLADHIDLACRVAPATALSRTGRRQAPEMTITTVTHTILLPGAYPGVTTGMQAVHDSTSYLIRNVVRDSERLLTELEVEVVTT